MLRFKDIKTKTQEKEEEKQQQLLEEQQQIEEEKQNKVFKQDSQLSGFNKKNKHNRNNFSKDDFKRQREDQQQDDQDEVVIVYASHLARSSDFVSRYFAKYFRKYKNKQDSTINEDHYAFKHRNKLALIGISENHEIRRNKLKIKSISFDCVYVGDLKDLTKGKKKAGSISIIPSKKIADIECENGQHFNVFGVINGSIIELNEHLIENPNWIVEDGNNTGYIAICDLAKKKKTQFETDENLIPESKYDIPFQQTQLQEQDQSIINNNTDNSNTKNGENEKINTQETQINTENQNNNNTLQNNEQKEQQQE